MPMNAYTCLRVTDTVYTAIILVYGAVSVTIMNQFDSDIGRERPVRCGWKNETEKYINYNRKH